MVPGLISALVRLPAIIIAAPAAPIATPAESTFTFFALSPSQAFVAYTGSLFCATHAWYVEGGALPVLVSSTRAVVTATMPVATPAMPRASPDQNRAPWPPSWEPCSAAIAAAAFSTDLLIG